MTDGSKVAQEGQEAMSFAEFLESTPPSSLTSISDLGERKYHQSGSFRGVFLRSPEIQLHCPDDSCNGTRFFRATTRSEIRISDEYAFVYISYLCSNCRKHKKTFSLALQAEGADGAGSCYKFGEMPLYGP